MLFWIFFRISGLDRIGFEQNDQYTNPNPKFFEFEIESKSKISNSKKYN